MLDGIINKLKNMRKKSFLSNSEHRYIGSGLTNTMTFYKGKAFDNAYPNISRIANKFLTIRPYAIDANGKTVQNARLINKIYHPNQQMSSVDFRETLAVMVLVHRKAYLLVYREENGAAIAGGNINESNIAGFTFLEGVSEIVVNGQKKYRVGTSEYSTDEVIEIFAGVDPYGLDRGYSPSIAADKWASIDDYIAAYQAGLFENGGVPAGQFVITAPNVEAFNNIVDEMERKHRGAGRNNNVVYTMRPIDPNTGATQAAQIEWIPFAQNNRDMKLDSLFAQTNKKLDASYGVPDEIKGFLKNSNYASVAVAERIFLEYTVDPLALKIWTRFTHEMNRITGGLGYAIAYELDIPNLADEDKVRAETRSIDMQTVREMVDAGYSIDSVIDALDLPVSYKLLKADNGGSATIENDKPEVDEGGEVEDSPTPATKGILMKQHSHHHHKIKAANQDVVDQVADVVRGHMSRQIEKAIAEEVVNKGVNDADEDKEATLEMVADLLTVLTLYMLASGKLSYAEGIKLLKKNDISTSAVTEYAVSDVAKSRYHSYLTNVATSYREETARQIRNILGKGQVEEWDKETIATELRGIMDTDEWRVQRLARTEEHRCVGQASIDAMQQLMYETSTVIYKVWHTNGAGCEFCQAMNGKKEVVGKSFLPVGEKLEGAEGGTFINDFADIDAANMHPNCSCYVQYEVQKT